jgi:glutathione S-transferase
MKLYDLELSGNCYKVRLFAALIGVPLELIAVDLMNGEQKRPEFLKLNLLGQVPVLVEGDLVLRDSQAILVYLARRYGGEDWLPSEAADMARITQWLSTAANEIAHGPADARLHDKFGYPIDVEQTRAKAHHILEIIDQQLSGRAWLELSRPTIADIACFPYVALAPEGGVSLAAYPNVKTWIGRIQALPRFVTMPGIG